MTRKEKRLVWEERISSYKQSGLSIAKWCDENNVHESQFYYWKKKLNTDPKVDNTSSKWLSVEVDKYDNNPDSSILIKLGQASIEIKHGFDPSLLSEVVKALRID
ncbi:IS66 family insertion sequence element accessory protein TnpA, partial [Oceanobacillus caeni]